MEYNKGLVLLSAWSAHSLHSSWLRQIYVSLRGLLTGPRPSKLLEAWNSVFMFFFSSLNVSKLLFFLLCYQGIPGPKGSQVCESPCLYQSGSKSFANGQADVNTIIGPDTGKTMKYLLRQMAEKQHVYLTNSSVTAGNTPCHNVLISCLVSVSFAWGHRGPNLTRGLSHSMCCILARMDMDQEFGNQTSKLELHIFQIYMRW